MKTPRRIVRPVTVITMVSSLAIGSIIVMCASLMVGSVPVSLGELLRLVQDSFSAHQDPALKTIRAVVLEIRLPRVLFAALAGGSLSLAGVIFQLLLQNVLADPYILGISGGASLGAIAALSFGFVTATSFLVPMFAFTGASLVILLVYIIGIHGPASDSNGLLLSGVMISAFVSAIVLAFVAIAGDPVRTALFWMLGYCGHVDIRIISFIAPVIIAAGTFVYFLAREMNLLMLGKDAAVQLGVSVRRMNFTLYLLGSVLTSVIVSFAGAIGFVGLIVPHLARLATGTDHRILVPSSFFIGAMFLVVSDTIARSMLAPAEVPVGVVTAFIGAPMFVYLLKRST